MTSVFEIETSSEDYFWLQIACEKCETLYRLKVHKLDNIHRWKKTWQGKIDQKTQASIENTI